MPEDIEEGWVRLRLATASVCGTDMHYFRHFANAGFEFAYPVTLGHEACAWIEEPNGSRFEAGQLVAVNPVIECGSCDACRRGDINMCPGKRFPGSATTNPHIDGFFRQIFDFPARCCHPVAADANPEHLTLAEPLACAMHAINRAGVESGMDVLITGCGPMGLLAVIAAAARGAEVHVTDLRSEAVNAALALGATRGFVPGSHDTPAGVYDVVVEASGSPHAFNQAIDSVHKQGTISILSLIQPRPATVNLHLIALKEITIIGSILFTGEFSDSLDLIQSGSVDFDAMIGRRVTFEDLQAGCEGVDAGTVVGKLLVKPPAG